MAGRQTCVGCGSVSPETNGENTLTTSFGWRIRRADVGRGIEWRCPACWARFKASLAPGVSSGSGEYPSTSPPRDPDKS